MTGETDEIKRLVELGAISEELGKKASPLLDDVSVEKTKGSIRGRFSDGSEAIVGNKVFTCSCGAVDDTTFCEHVLATAIKGKKLKSVLVGKAHPGGYWCMKFLDSGVVSESIIRGALDIIDSKQIKVVKNLEGVYEGEIITESGTKIYTRVTSDYVSCSRCSRSCRHVVATLIEANDQEILKKAALEGLERRDYYQEEEKVIEGEIIRFNRYTRGYLLKSGDDEFWVNGFIRDGQPGDRVKLKIKERGKSRKILEVIEHEKVGEVTSTTTTTTTTATTPSLDKEVVISSPETGQGAVMSVGDGVVAKVKHRTTVEPVVVGTDVLEQGEIVAELLDELDEAMMESEVILGAPALVYEVPAWKCPKCKVLRSTRYCDKCKVKIPETELFLRKQLTWEGISEAVHRQGNLKVKKAELRQEEIVVNGRKKTVVYAYVEVVDQRRNTVLFGVSDKADPTRPFYITHLFSKAERNAFRKALKKQTIDKVIKYAEEIGAVYRAEPSDFMR